MNLINSIFKGDKVIWMIFLMLCLISITEVFSASSTLTYGSQSHWGPITRHTMFLLGGAAFVVLIHNIPYKWFRGLPILLIPISVVFLLMLLFFDNLNIGGILVIEKTNDAGRWVKILNMPFQPSEFAKMATIVLTASILSKGQTEDEASQNSFKWILTSTALICLLIMPENYSTAFLLFGTIYLMMFIGRVNTKKVLMLGGILLSVAAFSVGTLLYTPDNVIEKVPMGHRLTTVKHRIENFIRGEKVPAAKYDIQGDGAQVGHARIAVASSNILGKGPGNSVERDFLSQAYSDFIFAMIIEELGLIGGIFVVFLYICLLIRAGKIAQKCNRTFPAFLVLGIALLLVVQATFNMGVAVGIFPVTGQPLPLISRGGTSTIVNCIYIGMILSVSRYTAGLEEELKNMDTEHNAAEEDNQPISEAQTAIEPTVVMLNEDSVLE